jgi:hypothetical protein
LRKPIHGIIHGDRTLLDRSLMRMRRCECELHGFSDSLSIESRDITGPTLFFVVARERKTRRDWRRKEGGISDLLLGGWRVFRRIPQQYPARPLASSSSPFAASGLYAPRAPRTAGAGRRSPLTPAASSWRKCRRARELARGTGERIPASSACLSATAVILIRTYRRYR